MKTHVGAVVLRQVSHFRAAQQYIVGSVHRAAIASKHVVSQCLLLRRHLFVDERLEAITSEVQIRGGRGLCHGHAGKPSEADTEKPETHRFLPFYLTVARQSSCLLVHRPDDRSRSGDRCFLTPLIPLLAATAPRSRKP